MGAAVAVPAVLGAVGLLSANEQARKQNNAQNDAINQAKTQWQQEAKDRAPIVESLRQMLSMAQGYDPSKQTEIATNYASAKTADAINKGLRGFTSQYMAGGGTPSNDSEYRIRAQGMTDRIADPLRAFIADQKASEFQRKLAAFQAVNGGSVGPLGSNLAQAYFQQAQSYQPNYGPGLGFLSQALNGMFAKPGGAGGSGDTRSFGNYGNGGYSGGGVKMPPIMLGGESG